MPGRVCGCCGRPIQRNSFRKHTCTDGVMPMDGRAKPPAGVVPLEALARHRRRGGRKGLATQRRLRALRAAGLIS